jgi:hypothetical protein
VAKYRVLGDKSADAAKALGRKSTELGREANKAIKETTRALDALAPNSGRLKEYTDYVDRMGNSAIGRRLDGTGTKVIKEGAKTTQIQSCSRDALYMWITWTCDAQVQWDGEQNPVAERVISVH